MSEWKSWAVVVLIWGMAFVVHYANNRIHDLEDKLKSCSVGKAATDE